MKQLPLFLFIALMSLNAAAQSAAEYAQLAQRLEGTTYVTPHRDSTDGTLVRCGLEFGAMKPDFSTMNGAPVTIGGSFYFQALKAGGIAYMLKLSIFDGWDFNKSSAPANAFISAPNGKAPRKAKRHESENKSYALFAGPLDNDVVAAYEGIVEKKQLVVGFNRAPGQLDVVFTLDLTVSESKMGGDGRFIRTKSDSPVNEFVACSGDLMKAGLAKIK